METERKIVRRRIGILIAAMVLIGIGVGIKFGRYHVLAKRFDVVETGRIYRGGEQEAGPYERIIAEHGIRTVLTLLEERKDDRPEKVESELVETHGLRRIRIAMPGDGLADFDDLDRAAAILADEENGPIFVHCSAGVHRTGASIAAYRMVYQNWDYERAMEELDAHWISRGRKPEIFEHLKQYYEERVGGAELGGAVGFGVDGGAVGAVGAEGADVGVKHGESGG